MPATYNEISADMEGPNAIGINGCSFTWTKFKEENKVKEEIREDISFRSKQSSAKKEPPVTSFIKKGLSPITMATPLLSGDQKLTEIPQGSPRKVSTNSTAKPAASPVINPISFSRPLAYDDLLSPVKPEPGESDISADAEEKYDTFLCNL